MDISPSSWPFPLPFPFPFPFYLSHLPRPDNYVHWSQSPDHYAFSADLPGVRKEEIRVEVEDSRYLIIRTERGAGEAGQFMRKFRLPERIDVDGIAAGYENGVLTVTVPRTHVRRRHRIDPADLPDVRDLLVARAA